MFRECPRSLPVGTALVGLLVVAGLLLLPMTKRVYEELPVGIAVLSGHTSPLEGWIVAHDCRDDAHRVDVVLRERSGDTQLLWFPGALGAGDAQVYRGRCEQIAAVLGDERFAEGSAAGSALVALRLDGHVVFGPADRLASAAGRLLLLLGWIYALSLTVRLGFGKRGASSLTGFFAACQQMAGAVRRELDRAPRSGPRPTARPPSSSTPGAPMARQPRVPMSSGDPSQPGELEQEIEAGLATYRRLLEGILPPSQVDGPVQMLTELRGTVPPEVVLRSIRAFIDHFGDHGPDLPERNIRELQAAYVAAAPALEWWSERGRRGIDRSTDPEFLASLASDEIRTPEDREFAVRRVLWHRLQTERSPLYGSRGPLDDPEAWGHLPAPEGPDAPVSIAMLPEGAGWIEVVFPRRSNPFQENPRDFVVRLLDGTTWSLSSVAGVQRLFEAFPLDVAPSTLGSLLHWMLAPLPWGTGIDAIAETPTDLDRGKPEWLDAWLQSERELRDGVRPIDEGAASIFGVRVPEKAPRHLDSLALEVDLGDERRALVLYAREGSQPPRYEIRRVTVEECILRELLVDTLPRGSIKQAPRVPAALWSPGDPLDSLESDLTFQLDLPRWMDVLHVSGVPLISERAARALEEQRVDGYQAIAVTIQHAGLDGGAERRRYFILRALERFATERLIRTAAAWDTLPGIFRVTAIEPGPWRNKYRTGLILPMRVLDALEEAHLEGLDSDFAELERVSLYRRQEVE